MVRRPAPAGRGSRYAPVARPGGPRQGRDQGKPPAGPRLGSDADGARGYAPSLEPVQHPSLRPIYDKFGSDLLTAGGTGITLATVAAHSQPLADFICSKIVRGNSQCPTPPRLTILPACCRPRPPTTQLISASIGLRRNHLCP